MLKKKKQTMNKKITLISSEKNWLEGEAIRQLEQTAKLPGIIKAVGLPDLHPGKGHPVGAVFAGKNIIYPYLIGNDIGCGMALFSTSLKSRKTKARKLMKRLYGLETGWDEDKAAALLKEHGLESSLAPLALGSLGGGNHFVEFQAIVTVVNNEKLNATGLSKDRFLLLVHSGSRGIGEMILRRHVDRYKAAGLDVNSPEAADYLSRHNDALLWASLNRSVIARRILKMVNGEGIPLIDIPHNLLSLENVGDDKFWLHRKGAATTNQAYYKNPEYSDIAIIPGSRGSLSYIVRTLGDGNKNLHSLAHGAGRKWNRSSCKQRLSRRFSKDDLLQTKLGSHVICDDKELLYEEAPEAYKNVDHVVDSLLDAGLIEVIATMKPVVTYKKRSPFTYQ